MKVENRAEGDEGGARWASINVCFALPYTDEPKQATGGGGTQNGAAQADQGPGSGERGPARASGTALGLVGGWMVGGLDDGLDDGLPVGKEIRTGVSICFLLTCFLLMESDRCAGCLLTPPPRTVAVSG